MPELIRNASGDWAPQVGGYVLNQKKSDTVRTARVGVVLKYGVRYHYAIIDSVPV